MAQLLVKPEDEWYNWSKTVDGWNVALATAMQQKDRRMVDLIRYYDFCSKDDQVLFNVRKRIDALSSGKFEYSGTLDIHQLIKYFVQAQCYGYSVLERQGDELHLINRKHCDPFNKLIYQREYDQKGVKFERFANVFQIFTQDLGLFETLTPICILKNIAIKNWGMYLQRSGSGFRVIRTEKSADNRKDLLRAMNKITANSGMVIGIQDEFNNFEPTGNSSDIFKQFIQRCDDSISKVINGAVLGESSDSGSRAKEQVGKEISEAVTQSDKRQFTEFVNNVLQERFEFVDSIDSEKALQWAHIVLQQGDKIDVETLESISGLKITENNENEPEAS